VIAPHCAEAGGTAHRIAQRDQQRTFRRTIGARTAGSMNQTESDFPVDRESEPDWLGVMKELSVTDVARNFSAVLDEVGLSGEEVVLVRNRRRIARLVPESSGSNALEVFGDLYRTLDDATAAELAAHVAARRAAERRARTGTLAGMRDPWAG